MSEFLAALQGYTRKRVSLDDLRRHFFSLYPDVQNSPERGAMLLAELQALEASGVISLPAPGSWEKVGAPPLPKWVTLVRESVEPPAPDLTGVVWAPELGFWTELRPSQLVALLPINAFLLRRRGSFQLVPIKERSLEIFGDEKRLDAMCIGDRLFGGNLHLSVIGSFRVPQPLPYRACGVAGRPVLVVENHNTFWSVGEWNQASHCYSAVVYGQGQAFRLTGRALAQALHEVGGTDAEYFGDLDPKGIGIPYDFNSTVEAGCPIVRPALPLYRWLVAKGVRRKKPECRSFTPQPLRAWLGADLSAAVEDLWASGLWLPQEALGTEQLKALGLNFGRT